MNPLRKQEGGAGVPKIVDAHRRQLRGREHLLEVPSHVTIIQRGPDRRCKDEAGGVPGRPGLQTLAFLLRSVALPECYRRHRSKNASSARFTFGFNELELPSDPLQRLSHCHRSVDYINVLPPQAQSLAQPESDGHRHRKQRTETVLRRGLQQLTRLLLIEGDSLVSTC